MIRFNCHCTHEFLVPDDQAGGMVQCPKCRRLNDVPTLGDLAQLEDGGIFKIGDGPKASGKNVIPDAARAFTRDLRDESGDEIDLRPSLDDFLNVGTDEVPLELAGDERPGAPKYDPLTGELVETIDIKKPDMPIGADAAKIPVAKRAVGYATADLNRRVTPATILMHLGQPVNIFVMMFVVLAHALFQVTLSVVGAGIFFAAPVLVIIGALIIAHYGCVIDEIATADAEELPRPLRNAGFSEDIWRPFIRFNFAILVCFWPLIFRHDLVGPVGSGLLIACTLFGLYFFPAVLLTSLTAGTYLNLRPDRIIGVIRACGLGYWVSVLSFIIGGGIYLASIGLVNAAFMSLFVRGSVKIPLIGMAVGSPALLLGIYLFHFACWHLGLLYRAHHGQFPWVLQRHTYSRRTDTLAQLEAARKGAQRLDALRKNAANRDKRLAEIREAENAKRQAAPGEKPIWDRVAETPND